ncbi:hypothetical protein SanaruYs_08350 [Chryseotalea sanaruensis]|uniref:HTH arsR-type domain-containing protein n=1 Tax=Chryseotalea sanaruensis TaxID=2482724 RepID=A0A401U6Z8_9BACT|nr:ArsR family transcriptional regulator [Chryseotalea sanaruensis]GCC50620.1 hypothetical protein SanaruYs_08350 [Chryseotalea sanaruensis]
MLEGLITSRTRIKMLLKFFTNSTSTAYLRGLAEEFDESTNSIRHELNNLSKAGYLVSAENGRTVEYRANTNHPLFQDLKSLVHKYLGLDKIIENIVFKLGDLQAAYIIGDYAKGKDSGTIELLLVGAIDEDYALKLVEKAKKLIQRDIKICIISKAQWEQQEKVIAPLLLWTTD